MSTPQVIVYSTGTCPYCVAVMDWLERLGVAYEERPASERADIVSVPFTVIGDTEIVGFDRPAIKQALKTNGLI